MFSLIEPHLFSNRRVNRDKLQMLTRVQGGFAKVSRKLLKVTEKELFDPKIASNDFFDLKSRFLTEKTDFLTRKSGF